MRDYLSYEFDVEDFDFVSAIDDLPLWAAPFGLRLLDTIRMRPGLCVLDVGSGLGFPMVEIAQRLGRRGRVHGIDPWKRAVERIEMKLRTWGMTNAEMTLGTAEDMPFADEHFDLLVTNNGITNVPDIEAAFGECARVAKPGAQFVLTFNLPETMEEFYSALRAVVPERAAAIDEHIAGKRPTVERMKALLAATGFEVRDVHHDSFDLRFVDARTMFEHPVIKHWFLDSWKTLVAEEDHETVFTAVEKRMDETAGGSEAVVLRVPWVCLDCRRRSP